MKPRHKQIKLFDEIIVDNFAGGGGASTGIALAIKRRERLEDLDMAVGWRNESVHEG